MNIRVATSLLKPTLAAAFLLGSLVPARAAVQRMDLDGKWQVHEVNATEEMPATVPGGIYTDLLAARKIPDPFYRDNVEAVQWVAKTSWVYHRQFTVAPALLKREFVLLDCEGLDTLATVQINGQPVGKADNMFRHWQFDVKKLLRAGTNTLQISFASTYPYIDEQQKRPEAASIGGLPGGGEAFVRKAPYMYSWDWGPRLLDCGIEKPIGLLAYDTARVSDVGVEQDHSKQGVVKLTVQTDVQGRTEANLRADVTVSLDGKAVAQGTGALAGGTGKTTLLVRNPQLWWPNGMGAHPLYTVTVQLKNAAGQVLDANRQRVGLRTFQLLPKSGDKPIQLAVNGVPFFAKGANWIPSDSLPTRVTPASLRRYVADAVAVNMNTMRLWGGGYYEEEALYDACDEMGIVIWLDFKFANHAYPTFDPQFMENVRAEVGDNARRLRHHPCIAVWCGNNEIEYMLGDTWGPGHMGRESYNQLFAGFIPAELHKWAPSAIYTPGSPSAGDEHYWGVYHGNQPFESFARVHGFMTEFGMQSFPEPRTIESFTNAEDRASVTTPVMNAHQKSRGNDAIVRYIAMNFRPGKDFESTLWLSQIMQGYGIKMGAEGWRREMPRSTACIFWQYNDCWPGMSWSSVDYFGRWKALHYLARHFYAPLLVSGAADAGSGQVALAVTSDLRQAAKGTLSWRVTDVTGHSLQNGSAPVTIAPQSSGVARTLDLSALVKARSVSDLLVWVALESGGKTASENLIFFGKPRALKLVAPAITTQVKADKGSYQVTLNAAHPALWSWLTLSNTDAQYSDNFVHVRPGQPVTITVTPATPLTLAEFKAQLKVRSLYDTYDPTLDSTDVGNLALNKPVTVSSTEKTEGNIAAQVVDGDPYTRWSSEYGDPQWLAVDLGQTTLVKRVKLQWETAYARAYQIQISDDGQTWRDVYATKDGKGAVEDITLPQPVTTRYVRVYGTQRGSQYGYSLWELGVY